MTGWQKVAIVVGTIAMLALVLVFGPVVGS